MLVGTAIFATLVALWGSSAVRAAVRACLVRLTAPGEDEARGGEAGIADRASAEPRAAGLPRDPRPVA